MRHIKYTDEQRQLAALARGIAMNRDVLFHGTRTAQSILKTGILFRSLHGCEKVCLTRSAEVAAYWSLIERDLDEGRGSILVFDRQSLERQYKVKANPEVFWHSNRTFHDEAEEEIWDSVVDVGNYLIGFVSGPSRKLCPIMRAQNKKFANEYRMAIEARAKDLRS